LLGAAGDGRVSAATRADFAAAAAAVLVEDGHAGEVYELGGDEAFALADYAAALTAQSSTEIPYVDLPTADYAQALAEAGVDPGFAQALASSDEGLKAGELFTDSTDLSRLIGRPTTSLAEALAAALAARAEAATVA
ncbi:NAD(P)-dependent oxidoreductase, partial [Burkholderia multivorans]